VILIFAAWTSTNPSVRTTKVNYLFKQIAIETGLSAQTKKGNLLKDCLLNNCVEMDTPNSYQIMKDLEHILNS
jgi:hypothetical protein